MKYIDISVIVLVYNSVNYISKTIESLLAQVYSGSYEIIIVDNGSTDYSQEIIKKYPVKNFFEKKEALVMLVT